MLTEFFQILARTFFHSSGFPKHVHKYYVACKTLALYLIQNLIYAKPKALRLGRRIEIHCQLADTLDCEPSHQDKTPDHGRDRDFVTSSTSTLVQTRPWPVSSSRAQHTLRLLCTLKILCPPFDKRRLNGWWHGNTRTMYNTEEPLFQDHPENQVNMV